MTTPSDHAPSDLAHGVEFADNPEPRCPCVLLLDTSGSMFGSPIRALNQGLATFREELMGDALAQRRVEIAIVTFGGEVKVVQDFVTVDNFTPPELVALGLTPMGTAIQQALELIENRKREYKANGVAYYRPWVFLITDGAPEGEDKTAIDRAAERIKADEAAKRVAFFAVAVEGADLDVLSSITVRPPLRLTGLKFVELFVWLSRSTQNVAKSKVGDQVALPPVDWGSV